VICQYIEDRQPAPALLPADIRDRARARWLEEFADTRMGDVFIWRLFNQIAIRPSVWGEKGDRALVDRTLKEDVPAVLDYLEVEAPSEGFRFGALSLADIAIAAFFRNAGWVRFQIDPARWPRAAAWMARTLAEPAFAKLARIEDAVLRTPIAEQRAALKRLGAPVSADTYAGPAPRRGVMPI
jgi:glutathione S-transferase